ncbi:MerR family transcriptional regulator [Fictibacillus aquaticus]|uniref:MerR family transcriptional regulator n=1 Tax=Fictibacillus aquaticus TaxID=2021314 RepID=A0A235FDS1_9BACL|nr:MerR family transcriptional regulator [Fictibacillus aquaticus]OYD59550.1 MerR family transcriptional regulator [Fictibacillus aquaticus]
MYKVKEMADLSGVSVRTLHHYDEIGLLIPDSFSPSGYRLYSKTNLERLQQILFFKELGFGLVQIKEILDQPGFDRKEAMMAHKELLIKRKNRLESIIETVEKTIQSIEGGLKMKEKEMFDGFSMEDIQKHKEKYSKEARKKYGAAIVSETERKTDSYTKEDWANISSKTEEIYKKIASRMDYGPEDEEVQQEVGKWRQLITDNFYDCTFDIFRGLGDLYVDDPRFTKNIDKHKKGLASFLKDAMHVYCDRHSK